MLECRDLSVFYGFHQALDGISKRERSGKPLTLEQISEINKIMDENTEDALGSVPQSQAPEN